MRAYAKRYLLAWIILGSTACRPNPPGLELKTSSTELDAPAYTISAVIMLGADDLVSGRYDAHWKDGQGNVQLSKDDINHFHKPPILERRFNAQSLGKDFEFEFIYDQLPYSSGPLNFRECGFLKDLGFDLTDFKYMQAYYYFGFDSSGDSTSIPPIAQPKRELVRAVEASNTIDPKFVRCGKTEKITPDGASVKTLTVTMVSGLKDSFRLYRQGSLVSPTAATLSSSASSELKQIYAFTFDQASRPEEIKEDLVIKTPLGDRKHSLTFAACVNELGRSYGNPLMVSQLISEDVPLYLNEDGVLKESIHPTCCYSNGTCSSSIE